MYIDHKYDNTSLQGTTFFYYDTYFFYFEKKTS